MFGDQYLRALHPIHYTLLSMEITIFELSNQSPSSIYGGQYIGPVDLELLEHTNSTSLNLWHLIPCFFFLLPSLVPFKIGSTICVGLRLGAQPSRQSAGSLSCPSNLFSINGGGVKVWSCWHVRRRYILPVPPHPADGNGGWGWGSVRGPTEVSVTLAARTPHKLVAIH